MNFKMRKFLNEPMPCDGCVHATKCATDKLACYAFALFVHTGDAPESTPRKPTRRTYARVMWFEDASLIREINKTMHESVVV